MWQDVITKIFIEFLIFSNFQIGKIYQLLTRVNDSLPEFKHYLFKNDWFMKTLDQDEFYKLAVIEF